MLVLSLPILILLLIYYSGLVRIVRSLIVLEFMSFYILFLVVHLGYSSLFSIFFSLFLFLTFVIEGVVGILLLVFFINYASSSSVCLITS